MADDLAKRLEEVATAIEWGNPVRVNVVELLREAAKALREIEGVIPETDYDEQR